AEVRADKVAVTETQTGKLSVVNEDGKHQATLGTRALKFSNENGTPCTWLESWEEGGQLVFAGVANDAQLVGGIGAGKIRSKDPFRAHVMLGSSGMQASADEASLILFPRNRRVDKRPGFHRGVAAQVRMVAGLDYVNLRCLMDCTGPVLGGERFSLIA